MIDQVHPIITSHDAWAVYNYLISGGWVTEFNKTKQFAEKIQQFIEVPYASLCPNGTLGLYLALKAAGIGPGNRVAVPNYTMVATANAVRMAGAEPVFVDVDTGSWCMSPDDLRLLPEGSIEAVLFVEINGRGGRLPEVIDICQKNHLVLIEDACQAFGSGMLNKKYGSFGDFGVFSFSPHKIITTGQGGAVVTNNKKYYDRIEELRDFGRTKPGVDEHIALGFNFKFTDMQAALGLAQFETIKSRMLVKRTLHKRYSVGLDSCPATIKPMGDSEIPWFIELLAPKGSRYELIRYLKGCGIGTRPCYPALTDQQIYDQYPRPTSPAPAADALWLPSSLDLTETDVSGICDHIKKFYKDKS
jgi:perosamine synthetase